MLMLPGRVLCTILITLCRNYQCLFRVDVTRVEQWIPLRENFSLPFLWAQIAVLTIYFRRDSSPLVEVGLVL